MSQTPSGNIRKMKQVFPWLPSYDNAGKVWADTSCIKTISASGNGMALDSLSLVLAIPDITPRSPSLIEFLECVLEGPPGRRTLNPSRRLVWVNPDHVFALGTIPGGTSIWMYPDAGPFSFVDTQTVHVVIPSGENDFHWIEDSGPKAVAALLGIELVK